MDPLLFAIIIGAALAGRFLKRTQAKQADRVTDLESRARLIGEEWYELGYQRRVRVQRSFNSRGKPVIEFVPYDSPPRRQNALVRAFETLVVSVRLSRSVSKR